MKPVDEFGSMQEIGRVAEVWRYPVSSLAGEMLPVVDVSPTGIGGDRRFGLFERATGRPAAPEQEPKWRPALQLSAICKDGAFPQIGFPDGGVFSLNEPSLQARLSAYFGFEVEVAAHAGPAGGADWLFPIIPSRYIPAPLHLVTTSSLEHLAQLSGLDGVDRRRCRPSVLIESNEKGFIENDWIGQKLIIGSIPVSVGERTRRCGMTLVAQPGIEEEPNVLRGIIRHNGRSLGVYAQPLRAGAIAVGDRVYAET